MSMSDLMKRLCVASVLAAAACSEYGVNPEKDRGGGPAPDIEVDPPSLEFDSLRSGEEDRRTFTVRNVGSEVLHVSDVIIGSGLAFTIEGPETEFNLDPEGEQEVEVSFTPMGAAENFGQALVLSDDPDEAEAPVDLLGFGLTPELQITPDSYIFADAPIPCGSSVELELRNVGSEDLVITGFDYRSGGLLVFDDNGLTAQLPLTLAPDEHRTVNVIFTPVTVGGDTGVLEVTSNDPRGVVAADQNGEGSYSDEATESFTEPGVPPVDVMFLIDQSCSMEDDNTTDVQNGIPPFIDTLQAVADWQLIEITSITGCANGGIITPSTSNPDSLLINNAFNHSPNGFSYDATHYDPVLSESLLQLASIALDETGPGECNEGFMRPGALLHIIVLSDEPERSGTPYTAWINDFETYVPSPDYLKISSIIDINSSCGEGPGVYDDAANATGGSVLNICNSNWGLSLSDIASDVLAGIRTYNLSDPAVPGTIIVTVNGTETTDFDYTDAGNSVTINSPPVGEGDVVEITYAVAAECD